MKPVLLACGHAPPDRHAALRALAQRVPLELALYGGRSRHGSVAGADPPGIAVKHVSQREIGALAASGRYAAVIAGTGGRVALPAAWRGARRAGTPFVFWAALWRHPRTPAHALSYPLLLAIYRSADAVVTYGEHVSAYVRSKGARNVHVAPQAVDNEFWAQPADHGPRHPPGFLWVGRPAREKGLRVLRESWRLAALESDGARLTIVGDRKHGVGPQPPAELRNFYAAADVLIVPSIRTRDFLEPWGLVVNEAMNQHTAIIASDAVGAAAGGLVRHEHSGLIVPAGEAQALAGAIRRLWFDPELRDRLAAAGAREVLAYTPEAWAGGFARALAPLLAS
ncbi:MAG: glycosyltransferase family 4 protein [Solirubrobacteraceae bacterium]